MQQPLTTESRGQLMTLQDRAGLNELGRLQIRATWSYLRSEDLLFWLLCSYLFLEYVRPQTLYPILNLLPFTQIVILTTVGLLALNQNQPFVKNIQNRLLLAFFLVILLSSVMALSPEHAYEKLPDFVAWLLVYFMIVNILTTEKRFLVFLLLFFLFNMKMAQFAFRGWARIGFGFGLDGTGGGPGWFKNSGEFGIEMCIFFALSVYFFLAWSAHWSRIKQALFLLVPILALCGLISSGSRGAVVGGAAVMAWMLLKSERRFLGVLIVGVTAVLFVMLLPPEQVTRFESAGEDRTSIARLERWDKGLEMASRYPLLGVGFGNWAVADQELFDGYGYLSHNLFIECLSELGYSGLLVFLAMVVATFLVNHQTRKLVHGGEERGRFIWAMAHGLDAALVGYLVSGFFVTVMYYPYFWVNLALTVALHNIAKRNAVPRNG